MVFAFEAVGERRDSCREQQPPLHHCAVVSCRVRDRVLVTLKVNEGDPWIALVSKNGMPLL